MTATRLYADVARPGVIVSTLVDDGHVETVTFTRDRSTLGFDVKVQRGDDPAAARAMHDLALGGEMSA